MSPFDVEPPRWLQALTIRQKPNWGSLIGTALGGGVNALREGKPFAEGFAEARMNQQDPMWRLKAKLGEAQIANLASEAEARWMVADQKVKESDWMIESANALTDWTPDKPVPGGLDPRTAAVAGRARATYLATDLKNRDLEVKAAEAENRMKAREESVGLAAQRVELGKERLAWDQQKFVQAQEAETRLENLKQQGRIDLEKLRQLSRTDARGKVLTRQEYINRHLNNAWKMLMDTSDTTVTLRDAQKVLSDAYDALSVMPTTPIGPTTGTTNVRVYDPATDTFKPKAP